MKQKYKKGMILQHVSVVENGHPLYVEVLHFFGGEKFGEMYELYDIISAHPFTSSQEWVESQYILANEAAQILYGTKV